MSLENIGIIAEILGVFGVVASLIYLARQMRDSNHTAIAAGYSNSADLHASYMQMFAEEGAADFFLKVQDNYTTASPADQLRYWAMLHVVLNPFLNWMMQIEHGTVDRDRFDVDAALARWVDLSSEGGQAFRAWAPSVYPAEMVTFFNAVSELPPKS